MRVTKATTLAAVGMVALCASLPALAASTAPPASSSHSLQKDVAELKVQVGTLLTQQQQILDQLGQLKTMIQNQQAAAPAAAPQPPAPTYPASLKLSGLPVEGDPGAHIAIVEFTDFQCPFCGRYMSQAYPQIYSDYIKSGKVKYYYRDFPLSFHEFAAPAAKAARCAGDQGKFWEMHDSLFANQNALGQQDIMDRAQKLGLDTTKFSQCIASDKYDTVMQTNENEASGWGVSGTPTFFIGVINADGTEMSVDKEIVGAQPYDQFHQALEAELAPRA